MFESDFRKQIFDALKWTYHQHYGKNLPIYGIPFKLKEYQTSKKDISEGHEFTPPSDFRLKNEDIYDEEEKVRQDSEAVQNFGSVSSAYESEKSGSIDVDIITMNSNFSKVRSDTMFQKKKDE